MSAPTSSTSSTSATASGTSASATTSSFSFVAYVNKIKTGSVTKADESNASAAISALTANVNDTACDIRSAISFASSVCDSAKITANYNARRNFMISYCNCALTIGKQPDDLITGSTTAKHFEPSFYHLLRIIIETAAKACTSYSPSATVAKPITYEAGDTIRDIDFYAANAQGSDFIAAIDPSNIQALYDVFFKNGLKAIAEYIENPECDVMQAILNSVILIVQSRQFGHTYISRATTGNLPSILGMRGFKDSANIFATLLHDVFHPYSSDLLIELHDSFLNDKSEALLDSAFGIKINLGAIKKRGQNVVVGAAYLKWTVEHFYLLVETYAATLSSESPTLTMIANLKSSWLKTASEAIYDSAKFSKFDSDPKQKGSTKTVINWIVRIKASQATDLALVVIPPSVIAFQTVSQIESAKQIGVTCAKLNAANMANSKAEDLIFS